jgi:hypothetical protein
MQQRKPSNSVFSKPLLIQRLSNASSLDDQLTNAQILLIREILFAQHVLMLLFEPLPRKLDFALSVCSRNVKEKLLTQHIPTHHHGTNRTL